jgi:hypothetical protein
VDKGLAVVLTACVGGLIALQAPINSQLGRAVGTFQGAFVSFAIGTALLLVLAAVSSGLARRARVSSRPVIDEGMHVAGTGSFAVEVVEHARGADRRAHRELLERHRRGAA